MSHDGKQRQWLSNRSYTEQCLQWIPYEPPNQHLFLLHFLNHAKEDRSWQNEIQETFFAEIPHPNDHCMYVPNHGVRLENQKQSLHIQTVGATAKPFAVCEEGGMQR